MPNFVKIFRQIKKFPIQALDFDCSVCMAAICYSSPLLAVPRNEQHLGDKRTCAKFQIDSLKTGGIVRVYTDGRMDMAKSTQLMHVYLLYGLRRFLLCVKNFVVNSIYAVQGIIKNSG